MERIADYGEFFKTVGGGSCISISFLASNRVINPGKKGFMMKKSLNEAKIKLNFVAK